MVAATSPQPGQRSTTPAEALRVDALRIVSHADQQLGGALDERRRAAHVDLRAIGWRRPDGGDHSSVDPAGEAGPVIRPFARQRDV
jgi:hypothetical protein